MIIRTVLVISMLATVAPAAVKRDDFGQAGAAAATGGSQPVYSPSASSSSSYSAPAASSYSNNYAQIGNQYQQPGDHAAAASTNTAQGQQPNSGNLYYYYYPVQDKPKETGYQAASSNQYASAVTPNFGGQPAASSDSATAHLESTGNTGAANTAGSDLNYSAQDLSYSAQTLGQGIADYSQANTQGNSNYDQQLTNLASQLQQYGYSPSSAANAFGQSNNAQGYTSQQQGQGQQSGYAQNYYEAPQGSHASGSEQTSQYSSVQQIPNYQAAAQAYQPQATSGQQIGQGQGLGQSLSQSLGQSLGQNLGQNMGQLNGQMQGYHPNAAAQAAAAFAQQYPGAAHQFGNFPSSSGQHNAFEPAASGYRRYGIGSFLMPMLALAGLSLLIPTVTSLTASSRKKRSIDPNQSAKESAFGKYFDRLERYYSIYKTAVEREDCMNRIICELGDVMTGVRGKSAIFT